LQRHSRLLVCIVVLSGLHNALQGLCHDGGSEADDAGISARPAPGRREWWFDALGDEARGYRLPVTSVGAVAAL